MEITGYQEQVMCVARSALPGSWLGRAAALKMSENRFYYAFADVPVNWMPRGDVETDRSYKQLIPYVVLQTLDGLHTACYLRNGTETRLHALWSVGIGGHINEADAANGNGALSDIIARGLARELKEEFRSMPADAEPVFHGIINEEQTAVGHVHLGLVYRILVSDMNDFRPGQELSAFSWLEEDEVLELPLEIWSRLALNLLDRDQG